MPHTKQAFMGLILVTLQGLTGCAAPPAARPELSMQLDEATYTHRQPVSVTLWIVNKGVEPLRVEQPALVRYTVFGEPSTRPISDPIWHQNIRLTFSAPWSLDADASCRLTRMAWTQRTDEGSRVADGSYWFRVDLDGLGERPLTAESPLTVQGNALESSAGGQPLWDPPACGQFD